MILRNIVKDNENRLAVVKLELIEPELWFRKNPKATRILVVSLKRIIL